MPYTMEKGYSFNYENTKFPLDLSENVRKYLYYDYSWRDYGKMSFEDYEKILDGIDRSQKATQILCGLFEGRYPMGLSNDFDIIEDKVVETYEHKLLVGNETTFDHKGKCVYHGRIFDFEYSVKKQVYSSLQSEKIYYTPGECSVKEEGHDYVHRESHMYFACLCYAEFEKDYLRTQIRNADDKIWEQFVSEHKEQFIEHFTAIINNPCKHEACSKLRSSVKYLTLGYDLASALDCGFCNSCTGRCQFKTEIIPGSEHTSFWQDLKIDSLPFKFYNQMQDCQ